ncbi:MAG TPA: VWA domain-containing protein [Pirellulales bacterium]|nr:VWA domain-containing protein [Pirellulales bacterium]
MLKHHLNARHRLLRLVLLVSGGYAVALIGSPLYSADPAALGSDSQSKVSLLGVEGKGTKFVYVFDHSGSMGVPGNKPLDRAKKELLASIDGISDVQQFYIIFYNQDQKVFRIDPTGGRLIFGTDTNKKLAKQFVDSIRAEGATRHVDALAMALRMHPDVIFLLTDGDPPDDLTKEEQARLEKLNSNGTAINVIQISPPPGEGQVNRLESLAKGSGGQHIYIDFNKSEK